MANFNEAVLTKKGIGLLAKAQAGQTGIQFTRAVSGNGSYGADETLTDKTALKDQRQEFPFDKLFCSLIGPVPRYRPGELDPGLACLGLRQQADPLLCQHRLVEISHVTPPPLCCSCSTARTPPRYTAAP